MILAPGGLVEPASVAQASEVGGFEMFEVAEGAFAGLGEGVHPLAFVADGGGVAAGFDLGEAQVGSFQLEFGDEEDVDVGGEESGPVAAAHVFGEELATFFEGAGVAAVAGLDEESFVGEDGREMGSWKFEV